MGWSSDWLYELLLDHAREAWEEAKQAADERGETSPKYLLASEHAACEHALPCPKGDPIRIWSSVDDFRTLLPVNPCQKQQKSGSGALPSIFPVPRVMWYIMPDRKRVLICTFIGPRYGHGRWWDIVGQGKQSILRQSDTGRGWIS